MPRIILLFRNSVRSEHTLDLPIIHIGRTLDNDIVLPNLSVSRRHAQIVKNGDHYFIKDLNSTSGLFVNGEPVRQRMLQDGDHILIGKHTLLFQVDDTEPIAMVEKLKPLAKPGSMTVLAKTIERRPTSYLVLNEGSDNQKQFRLDKIVTTLGSGKGMDVLIKGFGIPEQVGEIHFSENRYFFIPFLEDIQVNDRILIGPTPLKNGDVLQLASLLFRFMIG